MSPRKIFVARISLRLFQLFCLLFVMTGLANVDGLIVAVQSTMKGTMSIPELCWKILPVTGPLVPALTFIAITQFILRNMKPSTHKPSEPWMANPMWAAKHIRLSNHGVFLSLIVCLGFFIGIVVPLSIGTEKTPFLVFSGIFGVVLLLFARVFWLNRKWNTAELRLATVPGVMGGPISGVAILQESFPTGTAFNVTLNCQRTEFGRTKHGTSGSSSKTETVWSSTISIDKPLTPDAPNRTLVPFGFGIPYDCQPTNFWNESSSGLTSWNLVVKQKDKVGHGGAVFQVPVFRTSDSRQDFVFDDEFISAFEQDVDLESVLTRVRMKSEKLAHDGKRITFDAWDAQAAVAIALMSLVCVAIMMAFFWFVPSIYGAAFASLFPGFLLFAGIYSFMDMLLWKSSIEISKAGVRCESGWHGFRRTVAPSDLEKLVFLSQFDCHKENGEWYRVDASVQPHGSRLDASNGSELTVVKKLDGRAEADAVAKWLEEQAMTF